MAERLRDWDDDWLVVGDEGANPFIFSRPGGTILHALHGEGVWEPKPMCESLVEMVTTLAIIGDIVASVGGALTDDDSMIHPYHRKAAKTRIGEFIRSQERCACGKPWVGLIRLSLRQAAIVNRRLYPSWPAIRRRLPAPRRATVGAWGFFAAQWAGPLRGKSSRRRTVFGPRRGVCSRNKLS